MEKTVLVVKDKSKSNFAYKALGLFGLSTLAVSQANAAALDTVELVAEIGGASTAVAALATASLTVFVGIKVFKWIKASI